MNASFLVEDEMAIDNQSVVVDWISSLAQWKSFLTLTARNPDLSEQNLRKGWRDLVGEWTNKYYKQRSKHHRDGYMSWVCSAELQQRGAWHLHCLIDRYVDFNFVHQWWQERYGFAFIKPVTEEHDAVMYVVKYILKNGNVDVYIRH